MNKYYNKYLKYKTKYLNLKNNNMNGGSKIKLTEENTEIIQVISNDILQQEYTDKLIELTTICEPSDKFNPIINEPYDIFWIAKNKVNKEIIGYLKSTDLEQFNKDEIFVLLGGIVGEEGLQISGACNGNPEKYSNLATLLLNKIEDYANDEGYQYILLHAGTDREYLIGEGERKGLYIKNGYIKQRILKKGEGNFADIDLWIMRKTIFTPFNI